MNCPNGHGALSGNDIVGYSCGQCGYTFTARRAVKGNRKVAVAIKTASEKILAELFASRVSLSEGEYKPLPWQQPWIRVKKQNLVYRKPYKGINVLLLASEFEEFFVTREQVVKLKGELKEDATPRIVVNFFRPKRMQRLEGETDEEFLVREKKTYRFFASAIHEIYPYSETTGIKPPKIDGEKDNEKVPSIEEFLNILTKNGLRIIESGGKAMYDPSKDCIAIPRIERFDSTERYYSSLFHELTHWTAMRVQRKNSSEDFREEYGREELVAEIGAAALCLRFKIDVTKPSAAYIDNWIETIKADMNILSVASSQSEKALQYLEGLK